MTLSTILILIIQSTFLIHSQDEDFTVKYEKFYTLYDYKNNIYVNDRNAVKVANLLIKSSLESKNIKSILKAESLIKFLINSNRPNLKFPNYPLIDIFNYYKKNHPTQRQRLIKSLLKNYKFNQKHINHCQIKSILAKYHLKHYYFNKITRDIIKSKICYKQNDNGLFPVSPLEKIQLLRLSGLHSQSLIELKNDKSIPACQKTLEKMHIYFAQGKNKKVLSIKDQKYADKDCVKRKNELKILSLILEKKYRPSREKLIVYNFYLRNVKNIEELSTNVIKLFDYCSETSKKNNHVDTLSCYIEVYISSIITNNKIILSKTSKVIEQILNSRSENSYFEYYFNTWKEFSKQKFNKKKYFDLLKKLKGFRGENSPEVSEVMRYYSTFLKNYTIKEKVN